MKSKEFLEEIKGYFLRVVTDVRINTACGHYDINKVVENFYIPILRMVYECHNLVNLNLEESNYPAVDLGCDNSRLCFQVTSTADSKKVAYSLLKFKEHNLSERFDKLIVLIITEKQRSYTSKDVLDAARSIGFDVEKDIIDYRDILRRVAGAELDFLGRLVRLLAQEFDAVDRFSGCREQLQAFLGMSKARIDVEKRSKKYIPDVFIEASLAKDKARVFTHPVFFGRKIFDEINRIDYSGLNRYLQALSLPQFEILDHINSYDAASANHAAVLSIVNDISDKYSRRLKEVTNYCEYYKGREGFRTDISQDKMDLWSIYKFLITNSAYGVAKRIEAVLDNISLFQSKILLVTSMAGQGKTNFICDFTENFCPAFEVPAVLIPARELNVGTSQSIFSYLTNNRYMSGIKDKFELLDYFEQIANETNKPFVILVDGLNEIKDVSFFNKELNDFLLAVSDYSLVKVILTCRTEFFENRFSFLTEASYSSMLYHLKDLKSEMSEFHLDQAVVSYLKFFNISVKLGEKAKDFLKRDLLLLRIFCENNEGKKLGTVHDIYKDELFEAYLIKVISKFDKSTKAMALPVLFKLIKRMIEDNSLACMATLIFTTQELEVIEQFLHDEIILRHELPEKSLSEVGKEYVNFTYDEIRDFVISIFLVKEVAKSDVAEAIRLYSGLQKGPAYEGVTKYSYILSRKHSVVEISSFIQSSKEFPYNYSILLHSFSPKYHNDEDIRIVREILGANKHQVAIRRIAAYLFGRQSAEEILNLNILVEHINLLDDDGYFEFLNLIFERDRYSHSGDSQPDMLIRRWSDVVNEAVESINDNLFLFLLQVAPLTSSGTRYWFLNGCAKALNNSKKLQCFDYARTAKAESISKFIVEITARGNNERKR